VRRLSPPTLPRSHDSAAGRRQPQRAAVGLARPQRARGWRGPARRGAHCGGRCCAPTALRGSPRGRAAKLAALATRAPLEQSPRVRSTKRASRADPGAALLGAADIAAARRAPPPPSPLRPGEPHGRPLRLTPARCRIALGKRRWRSCAGVERSLRTPLLCLQRCGPRGAQRGWPARAQGPRPCGAGMPVRSREAQSCRPARAARFVLPTRRECPSGARAASVASFAAGPARRASQGTPAKRGQAPASRRRRAGAPGRAPASPVGRPLARAFARAHLPRTAQRSAQR